MSKPSDERVEAIREFLDGGEFKRFSFEVTPLDDYRYTEEVTSVVDDLLFAYDEQRARAERAEADNARLREVEEKARRFAQLFAVFVADHDNSRIVIGTQSFMQLRAAYTAYRTSSRAMRAALTAAADEGATD